MLFLYQLTFVVCLLGILLEFLGHLLMLNSLQILTSVTDIRVDFTVALEFVVKVTMEFAVAIFLFLRFYSLVENFLLIVLGFFFMLSSIYFVSIVRSQP